MSNDAPLVAVADAVAPSRPELRTHRGPATLVQTHEPDAPCAGPVVRASFGVLVAVVALLLARAVFGFDLGLPEQLFDYWLYNLQMLGSAALIGWRALTFADERPAWAFVATGLGLYALGDFVWTTFFSESEALVTLADAFYLAMYPFAIAGIVLLVRRRIAEFQLSRWVDGIAAALIVATPGVVVVLEPTVRASEGALLDKVITVAYPALNIALLGAVIGVNALLGWRPGRAWLMLTAGLAAFVVADSVYAVQNLQGTYVEGQYDVMWNVATLMLAMSAWMTPLRHVRVRQWGWRAIALPVICQIGPMLNVMFNVDTPAESVLTIAVMSIVLVQLVVTRPRSPQDLASVELSDRFDSVAGGDVDALLDAHVSKRADAA
jgi:diguanylate cyclase